MKTVISALSLLFTVSALAQNSSIVGQIRTEILAPATVSEKEILNFGVIINESGGGMVRISPRNECVTSGELVQSEGMYSAGKFELKGFEGNLISVVLPQNSLSLKRDSGGEKVTVDNFTATVSENDQNRNGRGQAEISIGGTLHIGNWSESPAGIYTGTYEVVFLNN